MLVRNASLAALHGAAQDAGVKLRGLRIAGHKNAFRFTLEPVDDRWRRIGAKGRRVHAVCYHGHYAFFESLYERHPDARVHTALASYRSAGDFEAKALAAGRKRIGPGLMYGMACMHAA